MINIFGIKNCDTMKKAIKWLEASDLAFTFHDYRKDGITEDMVRGWVSEFSLEVILNKRGTTWRKLPDDVKDSLNEASAITLLVQNEAMIKRPIFDLGGNTSSVFPKKSKRCWQDC